MKKLIGIIAITACAIIGSITLSNATPATSNVETQSEDCKNVGNVDITIVYSGKQLYAHATNYNDYRVSIYYKIMATNGTKTYPVDSGTLSIGAKSSQSNSAFGPRINKQEGMSYYLEVGQPQMCN